MSKKTTRQDTIAYLFATQGLNLAIPSRPQYLVETKLSNKIMNAPFADMDQEQKDTIQHVQFLLCPAKISLNNGNKISCIEFINNKYKGQNDNSSYAI